MRRKDLGRSFFGAILFLAVLGIELAPAQTLSVRPPQPMQPAADSSPTAVPVDSIALTVPAGTALKVALDEEVRVRKVGQTVHGKVMEPVYAFDKLVVPAGSAVIGKVAAIDPVPKTKRTLAAMNANLSPARQVHLDFDELVLANGQHIPLQTVVSPGSQGVLQFVPANTNDNPGKADEAGHVASKKISEARQEVKRQWSEAMKQLHAPGKVHRLERLALAQLPYHPQYMDPGTGFNVDLQSPLSFGSESLQPEMLSAIGNPPPSGSVVHALLITPLSSATARKGDPVEAVITQPLVAAGQLLLPAGSRIKGSVLQVRAARRLNRNGQLRIVFHQIVPPSGLEEKVEASLEGVEVAKGDHLSLDAEGGAQVTSPKTRYLTTALSVALAASSTSGDNDGLHSGSDASGGAANGFSGFGVIGTIAGALARSRAVSSGFGFYGAAMSVYSHFFARGRDVVYPKDMSMVIGLGMREKKTTETAQARVP